MATTVRMRSRIRAKATALGLGLQLAAVPLLAQGGQNPAVDTLFPARPTGFVTDVAGLVAPGTRSDLEQLLTKLRAATGAELAVVTLPTIGDRSEDEVALAIGRRWGVGARAAIGDSTRNAGLVLLVVPRQNHQPGTGHVRIEVGQGLEGVVTDARAGQIRRDVMGPDLAAERYSDAIQKGTEALVSVVARAYGVGDSTLYRYQLPATGTGGGGGGSLWPLILLLIFFFMFSGFGRRRRRGVYWGGPWIGGGWGGGGWGGGGGFGGGGFGGFGGGGGFSGGGSGGRF
ncbi:MAG TPA: TPM domain-containing protein [Gemmatimonadales bacterium]|nr:TPM domain-containing protein [Gemmatimonadales bacterium]